MKIGAGTVVAIDYTLTDDSGEVIDSSDGEPLEYLHGSGQIVPGLERELEGRQAGESVKVKVAPADGYGDHDPNRIVEIERAELPEDLEPELGMELCTEGPEGEPIVMWITEVTDTNVTLDGNHPLAGQTLNFAIEVRSVRKATEDETSHGHVHGPGHDH